ncbi:transcription elongation factor GreA [Candidatus Uhrbacteria bacterium]|nr:transcription elongation factor GreA [Candidatus Uhrbacteria bacterium]
MTDKPTYVTKEGLAKLKEELHFLKTEKRREIAERIEKAKDLGDLSENAEYTQAKDDLSFTEGRIIELDDLVNRAVVIEEKHGDTVSIGATIRVNYDGKEKDFTIVGSNESDPLKGRISNESPLGQAFLGHKVGEVVEIKVPSGTVRYTIAEIK